MYSALLSFNALLLRLTVTYIRYIATTNIIHAVYYNLRTSICGVLQCRMQYQTGKVLPLGEIITI